MIETPVVSPSGFRRGYLAFQAQEPRDAMYRTATFLVEHFWGQPRDMADGMGVLLMTWNQAFYRYGSFDFGLLEEALRANMPVIEGLRNRSIESLSDADEPVVEKLFLEFLIALRIAEGKKAGNRSPVAVAKALHLLAPAFFPLWDKAIARAYGCDYSVRPEKKYLEFADVMQRLFRQLGNCVPPDCGRTFLKLVDEYNYAKFTKAWV